MEAEGRRAVAIRDPSGMTDSVLVVSPETIFVLSCFDGRSTLRDVQAECTRKFGEIVPLDQIRDLAEAIDEALMLDSEAFRARVAEIERAFRASPVRPAAHAGGAYEGDPDLLRAGLAGLLAAAPAAPLPPGKIAGLIAPHIDLHRGGEGYGAAYAALAADRDAATFVVLGTAHQAPPEMYVATRKAYATPLGEVPADTHLLDAIAARVGDRLFREELVHRKEHSIEFQAVWLRHLFPAREIRMVPILCSSFHECVASGRSPLEDARISDFVSALREAIEGRGDVRLIAGADLAHLGTRFGDPLTVSEADTASCAHADRQALAATARRDPEAFFRGIADEGDRRRVCGISAIYTLLHALPRAARGTLLHYGQALDEEATTFVSFASMAFTTP
ncbi:MAG: AmmeMemoRadiSam system protein B [Acidobacteria bacterium]|nr:AmmeMemoRadiSam system protein B [Acidobacteriota bacterium]